MTQEADERRGEPATLAELVEFMPEAAERLLRIVEQREADPAYQEAQQKQREADEARAEADKRRRAVERLLAREVPVKDVDAILGGALTETRALEAARAFLASDRRILVLSGGNGCGKTTAASWLVAQDPVERYGAWGGAWPPHLHPRFLDVARLVRLPKFSDEAMEPVERCSLLAIDDLGMEYADEKGAFLSFLDGLLNARYASQLRTVLTTNLRADAFKARYQGRIADRIREVGRFVEIGGESLRGKR